MRDAADNKPALSPSIAVIGMGCLYPGAHSPQELWQNVLSGRRLFRRMPDERLPRSDYYDANSSAPGKTYCDQMAVISDWEFDGFQFRISPVVFNASDMAHWVALWTADQAIKDAGLDLNAIDRSRVGVILGNTLAGEYSRSHSLRFRWPYVERMLKQALQHNHIAGATAEGILKAAQHAYESPLPEITEDSLAGNMSNTIVGRVCNYFDFGGGGYTVDGACSSSLLSVAHACNALINNELDVALTGGVDISLDPFEIVGFAKTQALAKDDIRPYDENANGMITGEGCGVLVLMREEDARRAGYPIQAIIKGWGYSSDGAGAITAPVAEGQARALQRAYDKAGYPASSVGLFEGHGTGTPLGDKVEVTALRSLIDNGPDYGTCWIGSIKSNIGHCKAAAGAAGLIKAVMALKRKIIPPSMNCDRPNAVFDRPMSRLRPTVRGTIWRERAVPRRASVSSMGFGGANSHVTLEEADPQTQPLQADLNLLGSHQKTEVIFLSAPSSAELLTLVRKVRRIAKRISRAELTDLSAALAAKTDHERCRVALVTTSPWVLESSLAKIEGQLAAGGAIESLDAPQEGIFAQTAKANPKLAVLFPGQASQSLNMGEYLFRAYPFVRKFSNDVDVAIADMLADSGDRSLKFKFLLNPFTCPEEKKAQVEEALRETRIAQPSITFCSVALLKVLTWLGLKPDIAVGHSLGEITALHAMGGIDDLSAVRIAAVRGSAMSSLRLSDKGAMAAIFTSAEIVAELLAALNKTTEHNLTISNFNSPKQTVVSGREDEIKTFVAFCEQRSLRAVLLPVSHAFHSALVAPAAQRLSEELQVMKFKPLQGVVVSTSTGEVLDSDTNLAELLGQQIQNPVRFTDAIKKAQQLVTPDLWLEVGPGAVLTRFVNDILGDEHTVCLPTDMATEVSSKLVNEFMARAFVLGFELKTDVLFSHRFHRPLSVENYDPKFIVNPCERPVDMSNVAAVDGVGGSVDELLPDGVERDAFAGYLENNRDFIKQFITLDYERNTRSGQIEKKAPIKSANALVAENKAPQKALIDEAIDWISARTGFPVNMIKPEMKLRDDLNLDSIKVGELFLVLGQKLSVTTSEDSSRYVNARLSELVTHFEKFANTKTDQQTAVSVIDSAFAAGGVATNWTQSFHMAYLPYAISNETPRAINEVGKAVILSPSHSARAMALQTAMIQRGFDCSVYALDSWREAELPSDISSLVIVLPKVERHFYTQSPTAFFEAQFGMAATLYRVFQWVSKTLGDLVAQLPVAVVRDSESDMHRESDTTSESDIADINGVEGFLKSLNLEQESQFKFLLLPSAWSDEHWSSTVLTELQTGGERCVYRYLRDGERQTQMAEPVAVRSATPSTLGAVDVVAVSGGAKGITFELALALAQRTGCKLALFGSSVYDVNSDSAANVEITRNLQRAQEAKISVCYYQCNIIDVAAVQQVCTRVQSDMGTITGILHGAGIQTVNLFKNKSQQEFVDCLKVKMLGLYNLISAVPLAQLKALHVISSILGKTGMRGNTDYTYANAWLDSALRQIGSAYPQLRCLSMGYSVWDEVGMGKKLGALDYLASIGVSAIPLEAGVQHYLALLERDETDPIYITTGGLVPALEHALYVPLPTPRGRFVEHTVRWIPGVELIAESTLSHQDDYYLAEHVFEGTSLFPGVMALEAMAQAAQGLLQRNERPLFRNVQFLRPLITPEDSVVTVRVYAFLVRPDDSTNVKTVRVMMRSDRDAFQATHFSADCVFGVEPAELAIPDVACPDHSIPLELDPESLSPVPLFQGKFFRRINAIYQREYEVECVTSISIPKGARYFSDAHSGQLATIEPAVRDAFLQSGAIILPHGSLPESIAELYVSHAMLSDDVVCQVFVRECRADKYLIDIFVYSTDGVLLERMKGLTVGVAQRAERQSTKQVVTTRLNRFGTELGSLIENVDYGMALIPHESIEDLDWGGGESGVKSEVIVLQEGRRRSVGGNLLAARRAAEQYLLSRSGMELGEVGIDHADDGKPQLRLSKADVQSFFAGTDISISDVDGYSFAVVGLAPTGIDLEYIESRSSEVWRGLLGGHGYDLALMLHRQVNESFDRSATRVWTLYEAGVKAGVTDRQMPVYEAPLGGAWHAFSLSKGDINLDFLTTVLVDDKNRYLAATIAIPRQER